MLTQKEFDVLVAVSEQVEMLSSKNISEELKMPLGIVSEYLKILKDKNYIDEEQITFKGLEALEPYRVQRAIIMAAGFGSRLVPITLNTPKPLVRVKGVRMIDTLLNAIIEAGVEEIYVIRGYLKEQFDQLLYDYPMVKFIDNPFYNEANNISSLLCAGDLLSNVYIMEGDLVLKNKKLIKKYQYRSNFLAIPMDKTDDWCFHLENEIIKSVGIGGENCHQIVGISYWTEEDGEKFAKHINEVYYSPGGKQCYMSQVVFVKHAGEYEVTVRECSSDDIVEIDTFNELKAIDSVYDV